jgi:ubiquitin-protein ligase
MPTPREKRLNSDYLKVQQLADGSGGTIELVNARGHPPTVYVIQFHCPSLVKDEKGKIIVTGEHRVQINLGSDYPFSKPTAKMLTPVFNPHVFITQAICLGGRWTPVETLDSLILRIGSILQLDPRVLDYKSLANHDAGEWAHRHSSQLPLQGSVTFKTPKQDHV